MTCVNDEKSTSVIIALFCSLVFLATLVNETKRKILQNDHCQA
jgi:hypothetical protein